MGLEFSHALDAALDATKEVAETAQAKTSEFHESYLSKVLPDMGKYGDIAKFVAEMAPGVSEYNAIREGDWQAFAIAAGLDAIGIATGGVGLAVEEGGTLVVKEVAETGVKKAVKKLTEEGVEKVGKEAVEAGAEKVAKKVVKEGAEEVTQKAVEKTAKETIEKTAEETIEKAAKKSAKEVGEKLDKKLIPDYLKEVEKITNREIKPIQLEKLEKALKEQDFTKLSPEKAKLHRQLFDNARDKLIDEWEKNTGEKWPVYVKDVLNDAGEVIKQAGQRFDAHHLIESSFGGPNAWWNLHPAAFPTEHQAGIHGAESLANLIF